MRLIDADVITDHEIIDYLGISYASCLPDVRDLLDEQPTIEAVPVVHGEWESDRFGLDRSVCSICGAVYEGNGGNFCANCGAKMKGGVE